MRNKKIKRRFGSLGHRCLVVMTKWLSDPAIRQRLVVGLVTVVASLLQFGLISSWYSMATDVVDKLASVYMHSVAKDAAGINLLRNASKARSHRTRALLISCLLYGARSRG